MLMADPDAPAPTATKPYLIRALHEWCTDNGLTPYVSVRVDESVQVPREFVKDSEIVLNLSWDATTALTLGNDVLSFKARFSGVVKDIMVPVDRVAAIFARENGQGMAFPMSDSVKAGSGPGPGTAAASKPGRPKLTRVK